MGLDWAGRPCPATGGFVIDVLTYSAARTNLKAVMDRVVADRAPVVIARPDAEAVVIVSLADWKAIEETLHLLSTRRNAGRLQSAVAELDAGQRAQPPAIDG